MATSNNPDYSTSSCQICERVDTDDMVQCDNCDFWFHFQCVGVDGDIAFKDWKCDRCNYAFPTKSTADKENFPPKVQWRKPRSFRSLTSVSSAQSRDLALQRIEEDRMLSEQRDKEYLRRKYSVLGGYLDEFFELGEHEHNNQQSSFENTLHWAEKVQDLSDELANKFTVDNISISVTDNERETFQKQFLPQASSSTNVQRTQRATNPFSVYKDDTDDYNNVRFDKTEASKKPLQSTISGNKLSATYVKEPVKKNLILPSKLQIGKPFSEVETKYNRKLAGDNELTSRNFNSKSHTFGLPNSNSRDEQMSKVLRLSTTANVPPELNSDNFPRLNEHVEQSAHFGQFGGKETKSQHYQSTFQPTSQTMFQPARQSSFQPANQTQSTFQPASQPQFTFQPTNQQPGINAMTYRQPSMNQPASRLFGHLDVGKVVDYKALCKSNVNLTRSQIAMRQTMDKKYPHFSGEVTKWQMFESAFVNATESCGLTNFENLSRLMECLKGDAMKAVQCLLLHPNSVPGVMETLRLMFGRPELVIQTLLDELDDMDAPEPDDLNAFVNFALLVRNLCSTVQAYNSIKHLQNTLLLKSLVEKLPTQFKLQWASYQHAVIDVDLVTFSDWIYALATVVMDVINTKYDSSKDKKVRKDENSKNPKANRYVNSTNSIKLPQSTSNTGAVPKDKRKCPACSRDFCKKLDFCEKFKKMARQDKWKLIKSNNLCGSCLGNHRYFNCKQKIQCGVAGCSYFHHVLLHNELSAANDKSNSKRVDQPKQQQDDGQKKDCNTIYGTTKQFQYPEIFRIVPVKLFSNGQSLQIFAYFDDGSNLTTMESSVAQQLGLHGTKENLCVKWSFGETQLEADSSRISVQISGVQIDAEKFLIDDVRTVKQLKLPKQSITRHWLNQFPHFKNVPITPYENAVPQLIIGLRHSRLMVSLETLEGNWEQPIVCKTRLGWVVQGPNDKQISMTSIGKFRLNMCDCQASFHRLHQLVQDFFSLESFGVKVTDRIVESKELSRARDILESSVVKKDNHFEAALLWRADDIVLPNSFDMALRRLECVESKMKKDPVLAARMCDYINDFLAKGYIRKLTLDEQQRHGPRTWYLPVFPVFNPKKPEKLRLVWDAAAKVNGVSLNSQLLVGPDQLEPLPDILRRFREACIGLGTDIIEMYHRVHVTEKDRDSQRFFWREGDAEKKPVPDVYEVNVLPFGLKCSPAIAQFVKNKNAKAFEEQFAKAVEAITRNHYVDDMIERAHDVETAVQLIKDVQLIHRQANFGLRNLVSNNRQVLEAINGCSEFSDKILTDKLDFHVERVLGMFWNTQMDTFTYSLQFIKLQHLDLTHRPTKREVLRIIMSVFDPLGFLTHLLIHAKVILQEIWRSNITWDVQIPESLANKWSRWLIHLQQVENLHIPRLYSPRLSPTPPKSIQLHVFVDASLDAYATVAYFRIEDNDGVDSCIIGAKSRVAPIKPISVPRLELQGGLLGSRFAESILHSHSGLHVEKTIIWCDSKTVLFWLSTAPRRYSQFVAFRIGEILDSKINAQWRWIPSEFNVADEATKTKDLPELNFSTRWFVGPEFLRSENSDFTFELDEPDFVTTEEVRPYYLLAHVEVPVYKLIDYERFSNWQRLVRTMAYVLRFINNTRVERQRRCLSTISNNELLTAENWLFAQAQYDSFREDISIVRWNSASTVDEHKCFDKTSIIRTCSPYLDKSGVLRVMGRLDNAVTISESARRPIILAKDHYITRLIVYWYHHKHRHLHHQTVLNEIRQKFWIPKLRVLLNTIRNSCQKCKNTSAVAHAPEMGSIPRERFATYTRPFTFTGIDYFGPIKVIVNRGTQKRWGVLFTCMTTRAVHLEIAHSMDTSSCIMSIRNFIGRRGTPQKVRVDNGSNFHGADNALRDEIAKLDRTKIQDEFSNTLIEWSYNPPTAAHMGGIWERMVGIVKRCLDSVLTVRYPTDEMLTSLFIEVENMVNSRPLTYVTLESPYDEVLTPNHFLLGSSNGSKPPGQFSDADLLRNNWKAVQAMTDKFWQKFVDEYIPTLTTRTKWFNKIRPLQVGDVVLLADPGFQRNTWPKGIVIETFEDRTGQVRSAKVRTATGTIFRRPVHHLAILDVAQPDKVKLNSPSSSISPIQLTGSRMLQMDVNTGSVGSVFSSDSSSEVNRSKDETN